MTHTPRRRKLPKNITQKPDSQVAEKLFGKRLKSALDKEVESVTNPVSSAVEDTLSQLESCVK